MSPTPGNALNAADMTKKIEAAMAEVYSEKYGRALPDVGSADREILFLAISRGILRYLEEKEETMISQLTLNPTGTANQYNVTALDLNIQP